MYPWGHNRRFNAYSNYFKKLFGERIQKLSIDAGFSCPNRDGVKGRGGCTYCNNDAFNPSYCDPLKTVEQQIREGMEFHAWRYKKPGRYLAYFQPFSNTYAPLKELKKIYGQALEFKEIAGLVIGTRPDCIDDEKLEYFSKLAKTHYVIIEYGIESCYDKTLDRINRGHSFGDSKEAIRRTADAGIKTGAHLIFGLPGESKDEMMEEAGILSALPLTNIKFHQLQIIRETRMEKDYLAHPDDFTFFELDEYISFIVDFIEKLNPAFIIERFAGEVPPRFQAGPGWGLTRNERIVELVEAELERRDSYQGKHFNIISYSI
ncbi:MAG: TIGR01212 family radical SAM protein [Bacteroidales bacterium]|nr:TIGR01212 family radical SAM protein [Bacteroidales bacterium]